MCGDSCGSTVADCSGNTEGNANVELAELLKQLRESGGQACRQDSMKSKGADERKPVLERCRR